MKILEAKYTRRLNLGNYEHEELTLGVAFDESDDIASNVAALKATTLGLLKNEASDAVVAKAEKAVKTIAKEDKEGETATKADTPSPKQDAKADKSKAKASKAVSKSKKAQDLSEKEVTKDEVKKTFEGKAPKATVKYDREIAEHKHTLSTILDADYPTWKKDNNLKAKAGKLSKEILPGMPFKDAKGVIAEEFKAKIVEVMGEGEDL